MPSDDQDLVVQSVVVVVLFALAEFTDGIVVDT